MCGRRAAILMIALDQVRVDPEEARTSRRCPAVWSNASSVMSRCACASWSRIASVVKPVLSSGTSRTSPRDAVSCGRAAWPRRRLRSRSADQGRTAAADRAGPWLCALCRCRRAARPVAVRDASWSFLPLVRFDHRIRSSTGCRQLWPCHLALACSTDRTMMSRSGYGHRRRAATPPGASTTDIAASRSTAPTSVLTVSGVPAATAVSPATAGSRVRITAARVASTCDCAQLKQYVFFFGAQQRHEHEHGAGGVAAGRAGVQRAHGGGGEGEGWW